MTILRLGLWLAALLLAGCSRTAPKPDPAHTAMLAAVGGFLPKAEAEAGQCHYDQDRRLLDTYVMGLRHLRLSPAGGAELASETMRRFDEAYRACRQKMAALDEKLADIDRRCQAAPTRLGMTADQVLGGCRGAPDHINRSRTAAHQHEQWVYPGFGILYFSDGRLTAIRETGSPPRLKRFR